MFLVAPPGTALSLVGTGWLVHRQGPVRPIVLDISTMRLRKPMKDDEILPNIRGDVGKIIHYYSGASYNVYRDTYGIPTPASAAELPCFHPRNHGSPRPGQWADPSAPRVTSSHLLTSHSSRRLSPSSS
uniref:Uncharacterized protein n=1 Tax=Talaromyces marneffei PM1 TaxID=1077442 RepID=A0A093VLU8_TALMA